MGSLPHGCHKVVVVCAKSREAEADLRKFIPVSCGRIATTHSWLGSPSPHQQCVTTYATSQTAL